MDDDEIEFDEDAMPVPCQRCGNWFDLPDGTASKKWYPNTVICESCGDEEEKEINKDEEVESIREQFSEARHMIKDCEKRMADLGMTEEDLDNYEM